MAMASCMSCKRGANAPECPYCGGAMICDEEFSWEDGGPYPTLPPPIIHKNPQPSFFTFEEQLLEIVKELQEEGKFFHKGVLNAVQ